MISVEKAKQIVLAAATSEKIGTLSLLEASGLVLAADIIASVDIPNFRQSSMDGYALKFNDRDKELLIIGEVAAGEHRSLSIKDGEAMRIFTGAPLPEGADTVVMQEKVNHEGDKLLIEDKALIKGINVRPKGAEVKKDTIAIVSGTLLSPAALGFLAGIGCGSVQVYMPPKIAIVLTGDELQLPGQPLGFGQVYESNSVQLIAALHKTKVTCVKVFKVADNAKELENALFKALQDNDMVLLSGGVSVGDYDFVTEAAAACDVMQQFHKITQKPGKPLYFGIKGEKLVFGLPGNPSSSLTCFYEYVLPVIEAMMHLASSMSEISAQVTHPYVKPAGLTHFLKASYHEGKVSPLHAQESFRMHSFAEANCFIVLPEISTGCQIGDEVRVHLLPI